MIRSQEHSITELLKAVSAQNDQIDHQRTKIKILEEKVDVRDCTYIIRETERVMYVFSSLKGG